MCFSPNELFLWDAEETVSPVAITLRDIFAMDQISGMSTISPCSMLPTTQLQVWIRSLDSVLHNRTAFDAFHNWLCQVEQDEEHSQRPLDALELYLAILAFHKCAAEEDPKSRQMALALHRRYLSPRSGTCWFVPMQVRKAVSQRLHSGDMAMDVFDACLPHVWTHLSQQHALFVCSSHFSQLSRQLQFGQGMSSSCTFHYIPRLCNLQELGSGRQAHTNTSTSTPTTCIMTNSSRLYPHRLGARRRGTEQTPSTQRLHPSMSNRASSEPPRDEGPYSWLASQQPTEVASQTRRFQRQQLVLGHTIQMHHQRPEGRHEFAQTLQYRLNQLIEQVRLREEQTGDTIFPRDLHSKNNRQLSAWDEDDTLPPELVCEWMRNMQRPQSPETYNAKDLCLPGYCKAEQEDISVCPAGRVPHTDLHYLGPKYHECDEPLNNISFYTTSTQQPQFLSRPRLRASSSACGHYSDSSGFCSSDSAYLQYGQKEVVEKDRREAGRIKHKVDGGNTNVLIMSYRETDGVPFVVKLSEEEGSKVTFKEFRRQFGISSKTNKRFLFKSLCEDNSAPFQWTVANEDDMLLPVFEGRITAECRSTSESN